MEEYLIVMRPGDPPRPMQLIDGEPRLLDPDDFILRNGPVSSGTGTSVQVVDEAGKLIDGFMFTESYFYVDDEDQVYELPPGSVCTGEFYDTDSDDDGGEGDDEEEEEEEEIGISDNIKSMSIAVYDTPNSLSTVASTPPAARSFPGTRETWNAQRNGDFGADEEICGTIISLPDTEDLPSDAHEILSSQPSELEHYVTSNESNVNLTVSEEVCVEMDAASEQVMQYAPDTAAEDAVDYAPDTVLEHGAVMQDYAPEHVYYAAGTTTEPAVIEYGGEHVVDHFTQDATNEGEQHYNTYPTEVMGDIAPVVTQEILTFAPDYSEDMIRDAPDVTVTDFIETELAEEISVGIDSNDLYIPGSSTTSEYFVQTSSGHASSFPSQGHPGRKSKKIKSPAVTMPSPNYFSPQLPKALSSPKKIKSPTILTTASTSSNYYFSPELPVLPSREIPRTFPSSKQSISASKQSKQSSSKSSSLKTLMSPSSKTSKSPKTSSSASDKKQAAPASTARQTPQSVSKQRHASATSTTTTTPVSTTSVARDTNVRTSGRTRRANSRFSADEYEYSGDRSSISHLSGSGGDSESDTSAAAARERKPSNYETFQKLIADARIIPGVHVRETTEREPSRRRRSSKKSEVIPKEDNNISNNNAGAETTLNSEHLNMSLNSYAGGDLQGSCGGDKMTDVLESSRGEQVVDVMNVEEEEEVVCEETVIVSTGEQYVHKEPDILGGESHPYSVGGVHEELTGAPSSEPLLREEYTAMTSGKESSNECTNEEYQLVSTPPLIPVASAESLEIDVTDVASDKLNPSDRVEANTQSQHSVEDNADLIDDDDDKLLIDCSPSRAARRGKTSKTTVNRGRGRHSKQKKDDFHSEGAHAVNVLNTDHSKEALNSPPVTKSNNESSNVNSCGEIAFSSPTVVKRGRGRPPKTGKSKINKPGSSPLQFTSNTPSTEQSDSPGKTDSLAVNSTPQEAEDVKVDEKFEGVSGASISSSSAADVMEPLMLVDLPVENTVAPGLDISELIDETIPPKSTDDNLLLKSNIVLSPGVAKTEAHRQSSSRKKSGGSFVMNPVSSAIFPISEHSRTIVSDSSVLDQSHVSVSKQIDWEQADLKFEEELSAVMETSVVMGTATAVSEVIGSTETASEEYCNALLVIPSSDAISGAVFNAETGAVSVENMEETLWKEEEDVLKMDEIDMELSCKQTSVADSTKDAENLIDVVKDVEKAEIQTNVPVAAETVKGLEDERIGDGSTSVQKKRGRPLRAKPVSTPSVVSDVNIKNEAPNQQSINVEDKSAFNTRNPSLNKPAPRGGNRKRRQNSDNEQHDEVETKRKIMSNNPVHTQVEESLEMESDTAKLDDSMAKLDFLRTGDVAVPKAEDLVESMSSVPFEFVGGFTTDKLVDATRSSDDVEIEKDGSRDYVKNTLTHSRVATALSDREESCDSFAPGGTDSFEFVRGGGGTGDSDEVTVKSVDIESMLSSGFIVNPVAVLNALKANEKECSAIEHCNIALEEKICMLSRESNLVLNETEIMDLEEESKLHDAFEVFVCSARTASELADKKWEAIEREFEARLEELIIRETRLNEETRSVKVTEERKRRDVDKLQNKLEIDVEKWEKTKAKARRKNKEKRSRDQSSDIMHSDSKHRKEAGDGKRSSEEESHRGGGSDLVVLRTEQDTEVSSKRLSGERTKTVNTNEAASSSSQRTASSSTSTREKNKHSRKRKHESSTEPSKKVNRGISDTSANHRAGQDSDASSQDAHGSSGASSHEGGHGTSAKRQERASSSSIKYDDEETMRKNLAGLRALGSKLSAVPRGGVVGSKDQSEGEIGGELTHNDGSTRPEAGDIDGREELIEKEDESKKSVESNAEVNIEFLTTVENSYVKEDEESAIGIHDSFTELPMILSHDIPLHVAVSCDETQRITPSDGTYPMEYESSVTDTTPGTVTTGAGECMEHESNVTSSETGKPPASEHRDKVSQNICSSSIVSPLSISISDEIGTSAGVRPDEENVPEMEVSFPFHARTLSP